MFGKSKQMYQEKSNEEYLEEIKMSFHKSQENIKIVEDIFLETFTYSLAGTYASGTNVVEKINNFCSVVYDAPAHLLFNSNFLLKVEETIIYEPFIRDFILSLFTKFSFSISIKGTPGLMEKIFSSLEKASITSIDFSNTGVLTSVGQQLKDQLVVSPNKIKEYLTKNPWFVIIALLNVFSINCIKVMSDITQPNPMSNSN